MSRVRPWAQGEHHILYHALCWTMGPTQQFRSKPHYLIQQTSAADYTQPDDQAAHGLFDHSPLATLDCQFSAHSLCEVFAPGLVTRLCRHFLPDNIFSTYNWVFIFTECITSVYNSCLHAIWKPTVITEDVPTESS